MIIMRGGDDRLIAVADGSPCVRVGQRSVWPSRCGRTWIRRERMRKISVITLGYANLAACLVIYALV